MTTPLVSEDPNKVTGSQVQFGQPDRKSRAVDRDEKLSPPTHVTGTASERAR
jgi:hypothetical protein